MGKTLEVISDRSNREDDLVAAREVLDVRYSAPISLRAAKLLHLLVDAAGVDVCKEKEHVVAIQKLNFGKESKDEFLAIVTELFGTTMTLSILNALGKKATKLGSFLADAEVDDNNMGDLRFKFSDLMRRVISESDTWGVLSAKAVIAFRSRYSLKLYEYVAGRINQTYETSQKLPMYELRDILAAPTGKLLLWKDLRVRALDPAIAEVNQLAGFHVEYEPLYRARCVWAIKLRWEKKQRRDLVETARELERPSLGRKARRDGSVETISTEPPAVSLTFPEDTIYYTLWEDIARENLPEPQPDFDKVASRFRAWAKKEGKPLQGPLAMKAFAGFCKREMPIR